jgi:NADPH:quinone reductase-like Zn-dependent oxidoreductase
MKKYHLLKGSTDISSLKLVECETPEPDVGQVLIRVHAKSLNFRDYAIVTGNYFGGVLKRDTIPLSDGAGEIVAVGDSVRRVKPGDRVMGNFFQGWVDGKPNAAAMNALGSPSDGMLAEYVVLDQDGVVTCPPQLSYEEAATLPCAALTAWNALIVSGRVRPGQTVLTLGTGGVSIFALQFARMSGARVIVTSSSDAKLARAKELGAAEVINYVKTPDWHQEVIRLTSGQGVDHVIEVGGAGTLSRSFQCVGYRGQITLIGVLSGREGDTNPHPLMLKNASLRGVFVGSRAMFEEMNEAISVNAMRPVVDRVFPFEKAADAYAYQLAGKHFGKVVIGVSK